MIIQTLHCPHCQDIDSVRHGTTRQGKQRKRLVRGTICFSKTECRHDVAIGLFINPYEFGRAISSEINTSATSPAA